MIRNIYTNIPVHIELDNNILLNTQSDYEIIQQVYDIVNNNRKAFFFILKRKENKALLDWIDSKVPTLLTQTKFIPNIGTKCYWIFNGLTDFPKCGNPTCTNKIGENDNCGICGYLDHCCNKCKTLDPNVQNKIIDTCKKLYGEDCTWTSCSEQSKENYKKTCLERYGYDNLYKVPAVKKKIKQTTLERYGDENYRNDEQRIQTNIEKYGKRTNGDAVSKTLKALTDEQRSSWITNAVQTKIERYGTAGVSWTYTFDNKSFDSSWELAYYIWLKDHNIEFTYPCPIHLKYLDGNNIQHTYYPDFLVENKIVEIKGSQFLNATAGLKNPYDKNNVDDYLIDGIDPKYQCMIDNNVEIISLKEIKPYLKYITKVYGKEYLKLFKKNSIL